MVSRRNVISICIVIVVAIILVIMLFSSKTYNDNTDDNESVTESVYDDGLHYNEYIANDTQAYKETGQNNVQPEKEQKYIEKYIVRDIDDGVAIYKCTEIDGNEKEEFYDYALINTELCDEAMAEALKKGIELFGERELYEFLQAYSS